MNSSPSSIEDLNAVIRSYNPFNRELIVRKDNVWGKEFPDVPSINAHASDAVFQAIEEVRIGQRKAVGITLRAEKGLGKTHIMSRIRHRLQEKGGALFVYMTEYGSDLNRIKREFLKHLALSLKQEGSKNVMQWQELATAMINEATEQSHSPESLVCQFGERESLLLADIEELTEKIIDVNSDLDNPYLIQAILWTLSPKHKLYATNWLQGKSLTQSKADQMGLPNSSEEERAAEAFETICQLLDLISHYNSLVVCFDQIEGPEVNDLGFTKPQVIASLGMDLYNSMKRGVILVDTFPETWSGQIRALPYAESVVDRIGERIFDLKYLNSDDVVALVERYLQEFYKSKELTPIHPVYPFDEIKLRELGKQKATARDVLQWVQKNWKLPDEAPIAELKLGDPVELAFKKEMVSLEDGEFMDDRFKVAQSLIFGFNTLLGDRVEKVKIEKIEAPIFPKTKYIDFKVIGEEDGRSVQIGVAVLQESAGTGVTAGLSHLADYEKYNLTRGCLVRSKQVSPSARKALENLNYLLGNRGGEWVLLKSEEVKPLVAISSVYDNREDYELKEEQIFDFISKHKLTAENPLLLEIMSDPSGEIPQDAVDEEAA